MTTIVLFVCLLLLLLLCVCVCVCVCVCHRKDVNESFVEESEEDGPDTRPLKINVSPRKPAPEPSIPALQPQPMGVDQRTSDAALLLSSLRQSSLGQGERSRNSSSKTGMCIDGMSVFITDAMGDRRESNTSTCNSRCMCDVSARQSMFTHPWCL